MSSLLVLSPTLPSPPTDGGRIRVLNLLRQAANVFDVTLIALETEGTDRFHVRELRAEGIDVKLVVQPIARAPRLTGAAVVRSLVKDLPLTVSKYVLKSYAEAVGHALASRQYDLVHIEMIHFAPYLPLVQSLTNVPTLLSTQNVDSDIWRRAAEHQPTAIRRRLFRWQADVLERSEREFGVKVSGITAASERDAEIYREMLPEALVETIENGVDLDAYTPDPDAEEPETFVYTGSYDWLPNSDAVVYFCTEVWPGIRQAMPDARFLAVGKQPTLEMQGFDGRDGITVTGRVEDVAPYILRASVYVVPLRIGGGTRLKILEAMACGKAIVSTSIGCEGLDVRPGRDMVVADGSSEFVEVAVRLGTELDERRTLGRVARARVEERYGWDTIGARMNEFYTRLIERRQ